jgi:hypothetical protein
VRFLSRLSSAVAETLRERAQPVITNYELFRLLWDIYEHPENYPTKIIRRVRAPGAPQYAKVIRELEADRFLRPDPDFGSFHTLDTRVRVLRVSEVPEAPAEDIACLVDPFAFVGYLSAMQRYGLTVRQPIALTLATPGPKLWAQRRDERMKSDYGFDPREADLDYFKPLQAIEIPDPLRGRATRVRHTTRPYHSHPVTESFTRLIEVGDLFVQMLDDPDLCGGMGHVLDTWEEHAETYLDPIIAAVEEAPTNIIKVRAGHILSERLGISDPRIEAWKRFAQRGGSRKLDPAGPYKPVFSDDWMISLNA